MCTGQKQYEIGLYEKAVPPQLSWKDKLLAAKEGDAGCQGTDGQDFNGLRRLLILNGKKHYVLKFVYNLETFLMYNPFI